MTRLTAGGLRRLGPVYLLAASIASAQSTDEPIDSGVLSERGLADVERTGGFIVDRTVTNFGAEFFRRFSAAWRDQRDVDGIDVTIVERPSARFGSQIYIEHNNRPIARLFLYAGRSATIEPLAIEAARYVGRQLSDGALIGAIFADPDLARDEIK
jgi:curli production assembly/transport component CsgE